MDIWIKIGYFDSNIGHLNCVTIKYMIHLLPYVWKI